MDYFTVAALLLMCAAVYLVYHHKRRHRGKSIVFKKKKMAAAKWRRHSLLDRDRGKVIPFPGCAGLMQQNSPRQDGPNSRQSKK